MLTRAPPKAAAICRVGDTATRSLRAKSIYPYPDACGLSISPQARRAGLAGRLTNRSLCRARPHRSAVCCSITTYRGCPQKYLHRKKKMVAIIRALPRPRMNNMPDPKPLPNCIPRPNMNAPTRTCVPGGAFAPATFRECRCKEQGRNSNHYKLNPHGHCLTCEEQTAMCRGGTKAT